MTLNIVQFIREHPNDWEKILAEKPYALTITRKRMFDRNLLMLKYSQIDSDFSNPIVRECRGIILDEDDLEVVSFPFMKFCNYGETYADKIDWNSAEILEKIDGSLIKIVRLGNDFLVSTNGTIDADDAPIPEQVGCPFKTFGEAVRYALDNYDWEDLFQDGFTYMFELVSPFTRVVIPYPETDIYFLGIRNNETFKEILPQDHFLSDRFKTPKAFSFKNLDDCLEAAKNLPWDEEGYVAVDKDFHRVKIKSSEWIRVHHIKDNGNFSYERALGIVQANEVEEVVGYFPELKAPLYDLKERYLNLVSQEQATLEDFNREFSGRETTRKEKALWITSHSRVPAAFFSLMDCKVGSLETWFLNANPTSIVKMLGCK